MPHDSYDTFKVASYFRSYGTYLNVINKACHEIIKLWRSTLHKFSLIFVFVDIRNNWCLVIVLCISFSSASPRIMLQPPSEITVVIGNEMRLFVEASSGRGDKLYYQWFCNGNKLNYGTSNELFVKHANLEDQGNYSCRVRSEHGGSCLTNGSQVIGEWTFKHTMNLYHVWYLHRVGINWWVDI